jgi:hypothetical protein
MTSHNYILFMAEGEDPDWRERKLQQSGSLTWIIAEHWDSSGKALPEPGYRPSVFVKVDDSDPLRGKTHSKIGDWEVVRVESYSPDLPNGKYDTIAICYCKYSPIDAPLQPMPERQVSIDSFGRDKEAYQRWLESERQNEPADNLTDRFAELQQACTEEDYTLEVSPRADRANAFLEILE